MKRFEPLAKELCLRVCHLHSFSFLAHIFQMVDFLRDFEKWVWVGHQWFNQSYGIKVTLIVKAPVGCYFIDHLQGRMKRHPRREIPKNHTKNAFNLYRWSILISKKDSRDDRHSMLLYKLNMFGVHSDLLAWIGSHLNGRTQFVNVATWVSRTFNVNRFLHWYEINQLYLNDKKGNVMPLTAFTCKNGSKLNTATM